MDYDAIRRKRRFYYIATRGGSWSPSALFRQSEPGVWYDPSDFSTMFQDTAGTTPVTATGQSVALMLDKSKGLVLGPELVTNGTFDSDTAWTKGAGWTISGGAAVATAVTGFAQIFQNAGVSIGKTYRFTVTITVTSGAVTVGLGNSGQNILLTTTTSGTYTGFVTVAAGTGSGNVYARGNPDFTGTIDNISVKELPGNHATQSSLSSRPILGRNPVTGTRNLLTYTEQFDNAYWVKNNATVTANAAAAPDGTTTADALVWASATNPQLTPAAVTVSAGASVTLTVYAKAGTKNSITLILFNDGSNFALASFNLATGAAGTPSVTGTRFTSLSASTVNAGNGWYRCILSATTNTLTSLASWLRADTAVGAGDNIYIWGAQLETGSTATAYQKVVAATDVTESGVSDSYYLLFDGSDDFLVTGTITPGTDKAQVFAGVRKLSDAAVAMPIDFGNLASGSIAVQAPTGAAAADYQFSSGGTVVTNATSAGFTAPNTSVVSGIGDIAGDRATLRVNGTQVAQATSDQGTGNYLAYPLYIGRRGGASRPYNGRLYGLVTRFGANLTDSQISRMERWMNGKTGAY